MNVCTIHRNSKRERKGGRWGKDPKTWRNLKTTPYPAELAQGSLELYLWGDAPNNTVVFKGLTWVSIRMVCSSKGSRQPALLPPWSPPTAAPTSTPGSGGTWAAKAPLSFLMRLVHRGFCLPPKTTNQTDSRSYKAIPKVR